MTRNLRIATLSVSLLALLLVTPANALGINKSIKIEAGSQAEGASTVNGSITVGSGATVTGSLETVNGAIRIDEDAVIETNCSIGAEQAETDAGTHLKADLVDSQNAWVLFDQFSSF